MSLQCGTFGLIAVILLSFHWAMYNSEKVDYYTSIAEVGTSVTLRCQTKRGNDSTAEWGNDTGSSTVKLCKVGDKCSSDSVEANFSSGTYSLIIKNVTFEMAGTYKCDDDGELVAARLIVVDSNKSYSQEPIKRIRYDSFLELNMCGIKHDTLSFVCAISYMDSCDNCSQLHVKSYREDYSNSDKEYFSIPISDTHSMIKTLCRDRWKFNGVNSDFTSSTPIGLSITCSNGSMFMVDHDQRIVSCSGFNQKSCTYAWMNENMTVVSHGKQLDLNGRPEGNYSCIVNCSSGEHGAYCPFVAKQMQCTCNKSDSISTAPSSLEQHSPHVGWSQYTPVAIGVGVAIALLIITAALVIVLRYSDRLCRNRKPREREIQLMSSSKE